MKNLNEIILKEVKKTKEDCNKTAIFWNDAGNSLHQYNLYLTLTKTRK